MSTAVDRPESPPLPMTATSMTRTMPTSQISRTPEHLAGQLDVAVAERADHRHHHQGVQVPGHRRAAVGGDELVHRRADVAVHAALDGGVGQQRQERRAETDVPAESVRDVGVEGARTRGRAGPSR